MPAKRQTMNTIKFSHKQKHPQAPEPEGILWMIFCRQSGEFILKFRVKELFAHEACFPPVEKHKNFFRQ